MMRVGEQQILMFQLTIGAKLCEDIHARLCQEQLVRFKMTSYVQDRSFNVARPLVQIACCVIEYFNNNQLLYLADHDMFKIRYN
jgi:hypothetical protein